MLAFSELVRLGKKTKEPNSDSSSCDSNNEILHDVHVIDTYNDHVRGKRVRNCLISFLFQFTIDSRVCYFSVGMNGNRVERKK